MPELDFRIETAEPQRHAAAPQLNFKLRIREAAGTVPTPIHGILLHCHVRIEPGRRRYSAAEQERLRDLFGTPERWGQTLRPFAWTQVSVMVPPFTGTGAVDLPTPCSLDFAQAATKYFAALDDGHIPLCFLFSGTIFYRTESLALQVAPISWEKEADFRLSAAAWKELMDTYYPRNVWLSVQREMFDRLNAYRDRHGLSSWEQVMERLLQGEMIQES